MRPSAEEMSALALERGFPADTVETVAKLLEVLVAIRNHAFTRDRLALKGGTAINLFVLDVPRLSVDIDLNYVGSIELAGAHGDRPGLLETLREILHVVGVRGTNVSDKAAGSVLQGSFRGTRNQKLNLKIDLNWMYRVPLWGRHALDARVLSSVGATGVQVVDLHELIAGKIVALLDRRYPRDMHDVAVLLRKVPLDNERLRLGVVALSACSNRLDLRVLGPSFGVPVRADVEAQLGPVIGTRDRPSDIDFHQWVASMVAACEEHLACVLPLAQAEREFLDRLLEYGEVRPDLLTSDAALADRLLRHPGISWRALNVRKHRARRPL